MSEFVPPAPDQAASRKPSTLRLLGAVAAVLLILAATAVWPANTQALMLRTLWPVDQVSGTGILLIGCLSLPALLAWPWLMVFYSIHIRFFPFSLGLSAVALFLGGVVAISPYHARGSYCLLMMVAGAILCAAECWLRAAPRQAVLLCVLALVGPLCYYLALMALELGKSV